ncbi:MAG TPA: PspC domain-containing protein, partial [Candidatus Saccharimonadales bacterium]|nr:PspC domain-containing protein [Candidatus Saccharimonadales bacterium]
MNKVTTINLNGTAYQLEEGGYELLKKYLATAKKNLAGDPDKEEVLADFERAISEKCNEKLSDQKNVITDKEMEKIIDDMGPVAAADEDESDKKERDADQQPKRLYTLRDGAIIGGVANGMAAYFNLDVTIVRLIFVVLTFITSGAFIFVYLVAMFIIPEAKTQEQKAELRGERFSAQDVLERAKRKYADVSSKEHWQGVKEASQPALSNAGEMLRKFIRIISLVACAICGALLA